MNSLILVIAEGGNFDRERVVRLFSSIEGIYDHNFENVTSDFPREIGGQYDHGENSTTVRLHEDSSFIGLRGDGPAAIELVFRIQQGYPEALRVADAAASFDVMVRDYSSMEEFADAIHKGTFTDAEGSE